jgi:hypothetical protein
VMWGVGFAWFFPRDQASIRTLESGVNVAAGAGRSP